MVCTNSRVQGWLISVLQVQTLHSEVCKEQSLWGDQAQFVKYFVAYTKPGLNPQDCIKLGIVVRAFNVSIQKVEIG